jgi:hypothetical protein
MIEFALTIGLFLSALLGAITAGVYTTQRSTAVGAAAASARIAAGGVDSTNGLGRDPFSRRGARLRAEARAIQLLAAAMPGAHFEARDGDCSGARIEPGQVLACAFDDERSDTVTVLVRARTAAVVPAALGFLVGFPIEVHATIHRLTFAP